MKTKWMLVFLIAVLAVASNVGPAFAQSQNQPPYPNGSGGNGMGHGMLSGYNWGGMMNNSGWGGCGMGGYSWGGMMNNSGSGNYGMGGHGWGGSHGHMGGWGNGNQSGTNGSRITLDQATTVASRYLAGYGKNLYVAEIMEFSANFYALVKESDTGRGAFELLVDPYTGTVCPEPGPNMMWNLKYGHMGYYGRGDNTLTLKEARNLAQQALDANLPGATIEGDGISFYGYYTFDYSINGQLAGMLSVNGLNGAVWLHTWHGQFIAEKEFEK